MLSTVTAVLGILKLFLEWNSRRNIKNDGKRELANAILEKVTELQRLAIQIYARPKLSRSEQLNLMLGRPKDE